MEFNNYLFPFCLKNHQLVWKKTYLNVPCPCCKTKDYNFSRWTCLECKESYCVKCKPPIHYNLKCPLNHELIAKKHNGNTCDSCRIVLYDIGWRDGTCDFDLCNKCKILFEKED